MITISYSNLYELWFKTVRKRPDYESDCGFKADVEQFLKDTMHESAHIDDNLTHVTINFGPPKYETLFRLKYSEYIR